MITPLKLNMAGSHGFLSNARIFVTLLCLKLYTIMPSRLLTLSMAARHNIFYTFTQEFNNIICAALHALYTEE